jgi:hypothetical protein
MPTKKAPAKRPAKTAKGMNSKSSRLAEQTPGERKKRLAEEKKMSGRRDRGTTLHQSI